MVLSEQPPLGPTSQAREKLAKYQWRRGLLDLIEEWLYEPCACQGYEHEEECPMSQVDPEKLADKVIRYFDSDGTYPTPEN